MQRSRLQRLVHSGEIHRASGRVWLFAKNLLVLAVWLAALAGGFAALMRYEGAVDPNRRAAATVTPLQTPGIPTLFIGLHPKCPCSRASIDELEKIYSRAPEKFSIVVLAYKPAGEPDSWIQSASLTDISRLKPRLIVDTNGVEATQLGLTVSGQVALYGTDGQLLYSGGITGSRGHRGDNLGEQTVLDLLNGERPSGVSAPAFGCSLIDATP